MNEIKIGDSFKEFLYSDRRENIPSDIKIGTIKSLYQRGDNYFALITFEKKGQLKVRTEIEVDGLIKSGDFWIRK